MLSHQASYLRFCRIGSQKSKIKADSSGFGNQRYRVTIQLFAYLRLSPLDTPVRAECDGREKASQANSLEETKKNNVCLFLSSKQKRRKQMTFSGFCKLQFLVFFRIAKQLILCCGPVEHHIAYPFCQQRTSRLQEN